jgi:hypothetical protein
MVKLKWIKNVNYYENTTSYVIAIRPLGFFY